VGGVTGPAGAFVTWAPRSAAVRLTDASGATGPVAVKVSARSTKRSGDLVFGTSVASTNAASVSLNLALDGTPATVFVAGRFGRPSSAMGDVAIEVRDQATDKLLSSTPMMVRIRKNALDLTTAERSRFLHALAQLNNKGAGRFAGFRLVHFEKGLDEAHFNPGFLPWHRAFLLDLERELQLIDPSVALPYWRFDEPARAMFGKRFMGSVSGPTNRVELSADNPLQSWWTDGQVGFDRRPLFLWRSDPASGDQPVSDEAATLAMGGPSARYLTFKDMEGDPHGAAHMSFTGYLPVLNSAVRDPLFFMLHGNVDRLWAKWQWLKGRFDPTDVKSFSAQGHAGPGNPIRIGHNLLDTMWPWNGVTGGMRPSTAPGGQFPSSALTAAPGPKPMVRDMIDYQGHHAPGVDLAFDYDDVPFEV